MKKFVLALVVLTAKGQDIISDVAKLNASAPSVINETGSERVNVFLDSDRTNETQRENIIMNSSNNLLRPETNNETDSKHTDLLSENSAKLENVGIEIQATESSIMKLYKSNQNMTLNIDKEHSTSEKPAVEIETSTSTSNKEFTDFGDTNKSISLENSSFVSLINNSDNLHRDNNLQDIPILKNNDKNAFVDSSKKPIEGNKDSQGIVEISANSNNSNTSNLNEDFEIKMDPVKETPNPNFNNQAITKNIGNLNSLKTNANMAFGKSGPKISLVNSPEKDNKDTARVKLSNQLENDMIDIHRFNDINGHNNKDFKSIDKVATINNYKPKNVFYNPTIILKDHDSSLVESDFVVDGTLSKGIIFNSMNHDVNHQDNVLNVQVPDSSEESNPNYMVQFNKIHAALGKDPNSVFNEFTNLIFNYIKNRMTLDKDDVAKKLKKLKTLKPTDEGQKWKEVKPLQEVVVKDMVKELRKMVLRRDISLTNYNWLSSGVNIQVGIQKILKLCNSTSLSELDWKLMSFMEKIFEVMSERVQMRHRLGILDLPCTYFAEVLKRIRPLHKAMDLISSEHSVDREGMFEYLRTSYLLVSSDVPLQTILLHSAVNRVLEQIDSHFQDALANLKLKSVLEKKMLNINGKMVDIVRAYSELIEDLLLVYSVLYEFNRNTEEWFCCFIST